MSIRQPAIVLMNKTDPSFFVLPIDEYEYLADTIDDMLKTPYRTKTANEALQRAYLQGFVVCLRRSAAVETNPGRSK